MNSDERITNGEKTSPCFSMVCTSVDGYATKSRHSEMLFSITLFNNLTFEKHVKRLCCD